MRTKFYFRQGIVSGAALLFAAALLLGQPPAALAKKDGTTAPAAAARARMTPQERLEKLKKMRDRAASQGAAPERLAQIDEKLKKMEGRLQSGRKDSATESGAKEE